MRYIIALSSLLPLALAQYGAPASSDSTTSSSMAPSSTSSSSSSIQTITVGKSGLAFDPPSVVAAAGDQIVFQFYPGGHSVTQGDFSKPCQPGSGTPFFSGYVQSSSGPASQVFTVSINDTNPIFFYCSLPTHCQSGMVGAINPSTSQTLDQYKSAAGGAGSSSAPSGVEGGVLGAPPSASGSTSGSSTSGGASSTATAKSGSSIITSAFGLMSALLALAVMTQM